MHTICFEDYVSLQHLQHVDFIVRDCVCFRPYEPTPMSHGFAKRVTSPFPVPAYLAASAVSTLPAADVVCVCVLVFALLAAAPVAVQHSLPLQEFSSGCYNFCRFALLEAGQTSSSCSVGQHSDVLHSPPAVPPVQTVEGFTASQGTQLQEHSQETTPQKIDDGSEKQSEPVEGLLSQQLQQQKDLHSAQGTPVCKQQQQGLVGHDTGHGATYVSVDDLTEAAEELLVLGTHSRAEGEGCSSTTAQAHARVDSSNSRGGACEPQEGPCFLALPTAEPADCGIWQLDSSAGPSSRDAALLLLKQRKGADRPHRGQCMAVVLLQPQVRAPGGSRRM